ncbi:uncharacterized protein LOC144769066 [Lissotriton helveticus]
MWLVWVSPCIVPDNSHRPYHIWWNEQTSLLETPGHCMDCCCRICRRRTPFGMVRMGPRWAGGIPRQDGRPRAQDEFDFDQQTEHLGESCTQGAKPFLLLHDEHEECS